ncbi:sortase domain-bontaining protein [Microbacterium sp. P06]|uniref:class F sortase n=1 Tax=unclassified Microbacterium TaxID=2609290 RepID=UPI003745E050
MNPRRTAPLALVLVLSACAPAPAPDGAGAPTTSASTPVPSATPAVTVSPTPTVDVPRVDSSVRAPRAAMPPVRVRIAEAQVDVEVVPVGVETGGFMELPVDPAVAGWYRFGSDPWSPDGNTVVSAHIDAPDYPIGPFAVLRDLAVGTEVVAAAADGAMATYAVESVTYYPKDALPTEELFARTGTKNLVLITCGGAFDSRTGHYADNVVVIASPR